MHMNENTKKQSRPNLIDALLLVAAIACGLAACKAFYSSNHSERKFALSLVPTISFALRRGFRFGSFLLAFLTTAMVVVKARVPNISLKEKLQSYGTAACVSAVTAVAFCFAVSLLDVSVLFHLDPADDAWLPLRMAILGFGAFGGTSVVSVWTVLFLSGNGRRERSFVEGFAVGLGVCWIVLSLEDPILAAAYDLLKHFLE